MGERIEGMPQEPVTSEDEAAAAAQRRREIRDQLFRGNAPTENPIENAPVTENETGKNGSQPFIDESGRIVRKDVEK